MSKHIVNNCNYKYEYDINNYIVIVIIYLDLRASIFLDYRISV